MNNKIKITSIGLCFAANVFANHIDLNFVIGPDFSSVSNNQYMSPVNGLINSYDAKNTNQTRTFWGLNAEYSLDKAVVRAMSLGLGVGIYYLRPTDINGIETPGVNIIAPPQDTLTYSIRTKNLAILFEPRLIYTAFNFQPYILGGIGYSRNTLNNFVEGTVPGSAATPSTSPYPGSGQTKLAYQVGFGLQHTVWQFKNDTRLLLRAEYRYLNLGPAQLGMATAQTTNNHITANNINNIIDFGITYRL